MSEEAKIIAFVAFCVESYKVAKNLSGEGVSSLFSRFGVDRYLYEEYEVLHTMGIDAVLADIDRYLEVRGGAQSFRSNSVTHGEINRTFEVCPIGGGRMGEINQSNVHLLLPWKIAGIAELWARDANITPLEAMERFYQTSFYKRLADESTKLWHYSAEQLYAIFAA